jgi:hypothetical protein
MNSKRASFLQQTKRFVLALAVASILIPASQLNSYADAPVSPAYVELNAEQLDQLVAPIALDPDELVAQILTAATYPNQIAEANTWLSQNMNLNPKQRADAADQESWDPAVKALIEFPSTLDSLARNGAWTAQLGNAYYNQPGDVMNAIQAMRLQAQDSGKLVTTAQQSVVVTADAIEILPVNPAVIYVPYYNPWVVWAGFIAPYPAYVVAAVPVGVIPAVGISFDPPVAIGIYAGFDWGFSAWAPVWGAGTVALGGATYVSNSVTVINHGHFGYHDHGAFEHGGRGVPGHFHACAHGFAARDRAVRDRGAMAVRDHRLRDSQIARHQNYHPGNHIAQNHAPSTHTPVNHNPAHNPASHNPVNRNPVKPTPVNHTPSGHTPSGHTPTTHNPSSHTPTTHTPTTHTPSTNHGPSRVGPASSNRNTSSATNRTTTPNRAPSANRTPSTQNRSVTSANRSTQSAASRTPSVSRQASGGGGHSAPSRGRGR